MAFSHLGFVGDVHALELVTDASGSLTHLLAGTGSQLLVYALPGGQLLRAETVLPNAARVHGITSAPLDRGVLAIAVLAFDSPSCSLTAVAETPRLCRWTLAAALLPLPAPGAAGAVLTRRGQPAALWDVQPAAALAVGLSDNSVLLYAVAFAAVEQQALAPVMQLRCATAPLLYSMDLRWHLSGGGATAACDAASGGSRSLSRRGGGGGGGGDVSSRSGGRSGNGGSGGGAATLWVAAGTVFLDVLTWAGPALPLAALRGRAVPGPRPLGAARNPLQQQKLQPQPSHSLRADGSVQLAAQPAQPAAAGSQSGVGDPAAGSSPAAITRPVQRTLRGHEGSIHRVAWSADGAVLASASDDRSVRLWAAGPAAISSGSNSGAGAGGDDQPLAVLHGHASRLWDVHVDGGLVATGSEDRTVRLWRAADGRQLAQLHGHGGRGVWRVRFRDGVLASAGADASVKLWRLASWLPEAALRGRGGAAPAQRQAEPLQGWVASDLPLTPSTPEGTGGTRQRDSKSEFVRCIALADDRTLFVGTNHGAVHRATLPAAAAAAGRARLAWDSQLYASGDRAAVLVMAAFQAPPRQVHLHASAPAAFNSSRNGGTPSAELPPDTLSLLFSDSRGGAVHMTVRAVPEAAGGAGSCAAGSVTRWQPHGGRLVLGLFWSAALGAGRFFTADNAGELCLWAAPGPGGARPALLATAASPLPRRSSPHIIALAADAAAGVAVCGDSRGAVFAFALPAELPTAGPSGAAAARLQCVAAFPRIHGRAPVGFCAIHAGGLVTSGGRDGCIQQYRLRPPQHWRRAAAEEPSPAPPPPIKQQQQQLLRPCQQPGAASEAALDAATEADAEAGAGAEAPADADAFAGVEAATQPTALWRKLEAAGRQALVPSSLERLPGISTPVADVVVPVADAGSSGGGGGAERIVCGWQAADFIIASLSAGCELRRFHCGSLHRPFALRFGPGADATFVFHKGDQLHIHRRGDLQ